MCHRLPQHFHESDNYVFLPRRVPYHDLYPVVLLSCTSCHKSVPHHSSVVKPTCLLPSCDVRGQLSISKHFLFQPPSRSPPSKNRSKCFHNWNVAIVSWPGHRLPHVSAFFQPSLAGSIYSTCPVLPVKTSTSHPLSSYPHCRFVCQSQNVVLPFVYFVSSSDTPEPVNSGADMTDYPVVFKGTHLSRHQLPNPFLSVFSVPCIPFPFLMETTGPAHQTPP